MYKVGPTVAPAEATGKTAAAAAGSTASEDVIDRKQRWFMEAAAKKLDPIDEKAWLAKAQKKFEALKRAGSRNPKRKREPAATAVAAAAAAAPSSSEAQYHADLEIVANLEYGATPAGAAAATPHCSWLRVPTDSEIGVRDNNAVAKYLATFPKSADTSKPHQPPDPATADNATRPKASLPDTNYDRPRSKAMAAATTKPPPQSAATNPVTASTTATTNITTSVSISAAVHAAIHGHGHTKAPPVIAPHKSRPLIVKPIIVPHKASHRLCLPNNPAMPRTHVPSLAKRNPPKQPGKQPPAHLLANSH